MKKRVNMKLIHIRLLAIFSNAGDYSEQRYTNKWGFWGGVHSGHIQTTHYSSEGEDKRIYTFCITI